MNERCRFPILMALHICATLQDDMRKLYNSGKIDLFNKRFLLLENLLGYEHFKWICLHDFNKSLLKHWD